MHETIRKAYLSLLPLPFGVHVCVCVYKRDQDSECEGRERALSVCVRPCCNPPEAAIVEFTHSHPLSST